MKPFSKAYEEARYELTVVDPCGLVINGKCIPWRFDRALTTEEMEYGAKFGFRKFAVPFFDDEQIDEQQ